MNREHSRLPIGFAYATDQSDSPDNSCLEMVRTIQSALFMSYYYNVHVLDFKRLNWLVSCQCKK